MGLLELFFSVMWLIRNISCDFRKIMRIPDVTSQFSFYLTGSATHSLFRLPLMVS